MSKPSGNRFFDRRTLIALIMVMAVIQVGLFAGLGVWLYRSRSDGVGEPASTQVQTPSTAARLPGDAEATPVPASAEVRVGEPVPADSYLYRARMFDVESAMEHIAYLASDELGGRQPGTPGGHAAGDYIADRFSAYGLEPAGLNHTYYQTFTVPYGRITDLPLLDIIPPAGEVLTHTYAYRDEYRALTGGYLGAGEGEGLVVWLNRCAHDQFVGQDMVGKIVLCRYTHDPEVYRQAVEHRVGGLLLLDREGEAFRRGGYRENTWVPVTIPACLVSEQVGEDLLVGTDYTLDDLSLRFTATPLSTTVHMAVGLEERDEVAARNVLALLPGSDPEHMDEVVVIGAHYDHLGREPDGAVMTGANDNASGVAAILEIARLWQSQDFRPARSVLFAAWDGEEQGLLGSEHYVENPTYPITQTVAMLNLDMVGAGEKLQIDGEGGVAAQLQASAETFGITATHSSIGRSDHASFYEVGISAAMPIWWPDVVYHTPSDEIGAIAPAKLRAVGTLSAHTLAALADGHIELERAVERLQATIATGDRQAFLEGLDPTDADLQAAQLAWFDNLWSRELAEVTIEPNRVRIGAGQADVTLRLSYRWADIREPSLSYDVRFVERSDRWYFAGYELDSLSGDVVTVGRFSDVPVGTRQLLTSTEEAYLSIVGSLGLEPITDTEVVYYPDAPTMRAITRPTAERETRWLVHSAGRAEIAWGEPITPALVSLALNQMGLPPDAAPWLREGLALRYETGVAREYLPQLAVSEAVTSLMEFPPLSDVSGEEVRTLRAYAWSATEYLLDRYGSVGLRRLGAAWGESGDPETAFREALDVSPAQFESSWRADRLRPLRADAEAIEATVATRAEAVLNGEAAAFMDTISRDDSLLRAEERHWFDDLADHPVVTYTLTGGLVDWSPGAEEAVVELGFSYAISGGQSSQVTYDGRFVREGGRWLYAGVAWPEERSSEHFVLKYQGHDEAWAERVLILAEEAYEKVTSDLGTALPLPQEIKFYEDPELFRTSIFLSLPPCRGWTEPGEAIKLVLQDDSARGLQSVIAHELTHQVLFARGLRTSWLHEGVSTYEMGHASPLGTHWQAGQRMPVLLDAVRRRNELPLNGLPITVDELLRVQEAQPGLTYAQAWSMVSYIVEQYGRQALERLVAQSILSDDTPANLRAALGVDPEAFWAEWRDYVYAGGGVPQDLVPLAQRFDPERALDHIALLASSEYAGRQAGALEGHRAAGYIADQFAELGLEPLGDPLTATGELGYQQRFPISYTRIITVPRLTLLDADGEVLHEFTYREDFLERGGAGVAENELVWLNDGGLEGLRFGGTVVIERDVSDAVARAAQLAEHDAGGLIVVTDLEPDDLQTRRIGSASEREDISIPIFEMTEPAFETLLDQLDLELSDLTFASTTLPLGVQVRQSLVRLPLTTTLTANVIGLLPGSEPELADQVIVVGANYDHIGGEPDGLLYPGANHNASGVAGLLEVARVWRDEGYRPARSVLFVAWGAEELDSAGAAYYLEHPALPLTQTVGVISLDGIGAGEGRKLLYFGRRDHDAALIHPVDMGADQLGRRVWRRGSTGEGWHALFSQEEIPTLKLIWEEAEEGFYLSNDTVENIDLEKLATGGEVLTLVLSWLAGQ